MIKIIEIIVFKVSEKQRLNVACHLLLDTDIVLLDQPTEVALIILMLIADKADNDYFDHSRGWTSLTPFSWWST